MVQLSHPYMTTVETMALTIWVFINKVMSLVFYMLSRFVWLRDALSLPPMRETRVRSLGWEDPLEMETATHSSILAQRIPWMEELGRLQSTGSQRVNNQKNKKCNQNPFNKQKPRARWLHRWMFREELTSILSKLFQKFAEKGKTPNSFYKASIIGDIKTSQR